MEALLPRGATELTKQQIRYLLQVNGGGGFTLFKMDAGILVYKTSAHCSPDTACRPSTTDSTHRRQEHASAALHLQQPAGGAAADV